MEPDPLRAEWARWLAGIRRGITVAVVVMVVLAVLVVGAMVWEITRPVPPQAGRDPKYTMTDYLKATGDAPADSQGDTSQQR